MYIQSTDNLNIFIADCLTNWLETCAKKRPKIQYKNGHFTEGFYIWENCYNNLQWALDRGYFENSPLAGESVNDVISNYKSLKSKGTRRHNLLQPF